MTTQTLIKPKPMSILLAFLIRPDPQSRSPLQYSPQDLGYAIDEEELAGEMLAQLQCGPVDQSAPEIDPEKFETIYSPDTYGIY
jgi:hypothetical protein